MTSIDEFKKNAKSTWADFATMKNLTGTAAPNLVKFAGITSKHKVLDVACGSGVVALTAAKEGADVVGIDITPQLIERAKENAQLSNLNKVEFYEDDAEKLPFKDGSFDIVVSQFGHMFAPRPEVALQEMIRVLAPNGTIAFATWPPELFMGRFFKINAQFGPTLPEGMESPVKWGNIDVVYKRLSPFLNNIIFDRNRIFLQGLSVAHIRQTFEKGAGPLKKVVADLDNQPSKLRELRLIFNEAISDYFHDNQLRLDYLLTKASKF